MEANKISFLWTRIGERALEIANAYQNAINELFKNKKYDQNETFCGATIGFHLDFDKVEFINENDFVCSCEYNSACNCHPEYSSRQIVIPTSLLEYDFEGECHNRFEAESWEEFDYSTPQELLKKKIFEILILEKKKRDERIALQLEKEARLAKEASEARRIKKEEDEKRKYEELKKKFG